MIFSWYRALNSIEDVFISVELREMWRLHLTYGKKDGRELLVMFTQRFARLTTMLTLLVGSEVATLLSPTLETARTALETNDVSKVHFWAGLVLSLGIICSILSLMSVLTAWSLFMAIGPKNAHIVLRSSMILYAVTLPSRTAAAAIYLFIIWLNIFWYVIASWQVAMSLTIICSVFLLHIVSMYLAVGRTIMLSGAISEEEPIFKSETELSPNELTEALIEKVVISKRGDIPVHEQYRIKYQDSLQIIKDGGSLRLDELRLSQIDTWPTDDAPEGDKRLSTPSATDSRLRQRSSSE